MLKLNDEETFLIETVRRFVDREVKPTVQEVEHANEYPEKWIDQMKQIGIYGLAIPEEYGGSPVSMPCYAQVTQELSRGWMSLAGAMGGHTVVAKLISLFGTEEQKVNGKERETEPAYQRLSRELRQQISAGTYRDGIQLPTESELAQHHGVSRQTVRRAFHDLVAEGIVYRVPGRGTFVTENSGRYLRHLGSIEDLMNLSRDTTMEVVSPLQRRVDIEAASRLRLDTDVVYTVVFRRIHEGVPFVQTTAHLPEAIARQIIDLPAMAAGAVSANTVIGLLEPLIDSPIVEAAQSITVSPATADVARDVDCEIGHAMLRVDRLYSNAQGVANELSVSYFLPEQYTYRVTLRRGAH
eukprot:gene22189-26626_t